MSTAPADDDIDAAVVPASGRPPIAGRIPMPQPRPGRSLIRVEYAALNPADLLTAAGVYGPPPQPPWTVGLEGVGTVVQSDTHPVGSRFWWRQPGSAAAYVTVADDDLVAVSPSVPSTAAAALGIAGTTAWLALTDHARLQPGESVLVLGATGAVGTIAVQLARLLGAGRITAAGRHRPTLETLGRLGATDTVTLTGDTTLPAGPGGGYGVVVDALFGTTWPAVLAAAAVRARIVVLGASAGVTATATADIIGRSLTVTGLNAGLLPHEQVADAYRSVLQHAAERTLSVVTDTVGLAEVTDAWARQAAGPHHKILVDPHAGSGHRS